MWKQTLLGALMLGSLGQAAAQHDAAPPPQYDSVLASSLGADERGMRPYVFVILKTGPNKVPEGAERTRMFQGHFANMARLAAEKKLVMAGPLDGVEGRRGIFIFATPDIDEARKLVATDPVIVNGEMVAEFHKLYGSAALMMVNDVHNKIRKK